MSNEKNVKILFQNVDIFNCPALTNLLPIGYDLATAKSA
jgi:hypothetical protein